MSTHDDKHEEGTTNPNKVVIRNLFSNNYKEQNISKAYSYVTSTVQGSDGVCFTLHDSVTSANKRRRRRKLGIFKEFDEKI